MSNFKAAQIIGDYLNEHTEVFTALDFHKELKSQGVKISIEEARDILHSSNHVFPLVNDEFITRSGAFSGRWFSFKPTKEEVDKGCFLIGHRTVPFTNMDISPDNIDILYKGKLLDQHETVFSMNLAMDTYSLFGEGYVIPFVFSDKANKTLALSSVKYSMPQEITLTSWLLKDISPDREFKFGDRILCRVADWNNAVIDVDVLPDDTVDLKVSKAAIEREEWYSKFENAMLDSFDKRGPCTSIEDQLSLIFLEWQEDLCIKNCGSCEEFLKHTRKIGFSSYGVENRIWRAGEEIPYVGEWNKEAQKDLILSDIAMNFTPQVIDAFLEDYIYDCSHGKKSKKKSNESKILNAGNENLLKQSVENSSELDELMGKIFPSTLKMTGAERNLVLLNIEKRHDILKKNYNAFSDHKVVQIRKRILKIFSEVCALVCDIGASGVNPSEFPQQELIVLSQLYSHIVRLLEEVENVILREQFPIDDVALSLEGMEETYEGISVTLKNSLESNRRKGFGLLS